VSVVTGDELYEFYAQLGQAIYALQNVEGTLHRILCLKVEFAANKPTQSEADMILSRYREKPLGGLISAVKKAQCLQESSIESLDSLNADRKFVVHRLHETADEKLRANSAFRRDLVERLEAISDRGFEINTALVNELVSGVDQNLFSDPRFHQEFKAGLQRRGFI
jgi:hypothetical protein